MQTAFAEINGELRGGNKPALIMAALRSRCGHYIFALWFLLSFFFFFFLA